MVATRHPLAAEAGCSVLECGGNALDAAVAASLASSVVMPVANTIGGGGLLVVHDPHTGLSGTIDYRYEAPRAAYDGMYDPTPSAPDSLFTADAALDQANEIGHRAIAVPGSVAGLIRAHQQWGRLPLAAVSSSAIRLARDGFEMDWYGTLMAAGHLEILRRYPRTASMFLRDGLPYRPPIMGAGDLMRQPALADTLEEIVATDGASFYRGELASQVIDDLTAHGALIDADDLADYEPRESDSIALSYRGHTILGAANAALYRQLIPLLDQLELADYAPADPRRLHLLVEALRRCRAEQDTWYGDELALDHAQFRHLTSKSHAVELAASISRNRRTDPIVSRPWTARAECTMHVSAIDADRMAVSLTETILGNWGSGVTAPGGVLLNNGMSGFTLRPGHPNAVGGRKRPLSNMTPLIVLHPDGSLACTLGASGGPRIVGAVVQVLSHMIDHGLGIQEAIEQPRVDVHGEHVLLDARLGQDTAAELAGYGHEVLTRTETLSTFEFANPCGIAVKPDGKLHGGASPFQTTTAVGF